jgi:hypothetical protein
LTDWIDFLAALAFTIVAIQESLFGEVATTKVIDSRLANAFFDNATLSENNLLSKRISLQIGNRRQKQRGLWVGGKCILTTTALSFSPNDFNRALHAHPDELDIEMPLESIIELSVQRRLITDMITVRFATGDLKIRCFKARSFIAAIEVARQAVR